MIVPDFGVKADSEEMVRLKEALEARGDCDVKFLEVAGDTREAAKLVENTIVMQPSVEVNEDNTDDWHDLVPPVYNGIDLMVVFGRSAMLCGGVSCGIDILFINPSYTTEGEWRIQYYKDREKAAKFISEESAKRFEEKKRLPSGLTITKSYVPARRIAIFNDFTEGWTNFDDRYWPNRRVFDPKFADTAYLAQNISDFAFGNWRLPMDEVYEAIEDLPKGFFRNGKFEGMPFVEPVKIKDEIITGLAFGVPMANGQSCYKLVVEGCSYPLPLERYAEREDQLKLRDAIRALTAQALHDKMEEEHAKEKRILIVPDYFSEWPNPAVRSLAQCLRQLGYQTKTIIPIKTLESTRDLIEAEIDQNVNGYYNLIVAFDASCLLTARIGNVPKILINPAWEAWAWMDCRLQDENVIENEIMCRRGGPVPDGENPKKGSFYLVNDQQVGLARSMGEKANINYGPALTYGWFTPDNIDTFIADAHAARFKITSYPPHVDLETKEGIRALAKHISNIIEIEDDTE